MAFTESLNPDRRGRSFSVRCRSKRSVPDRRPNTTDCVVESPSGGTHHGKEAAERVLRTVFDAMDVKLQEQSVIIDGNSVAQVVSIAGADVGQFLGLSPTGKSFQMAGVFLYDLRDGLIARERRIYAFTALLIQVGLLKAKGAD